MPHVLRTAARRAAPAGLLALACLLPGLPAQAAAPQLQAAAFVSVPSSYNVHNPPTPYDYVVSSGARAEAELWLQDHALNLGTPASPIVGYLSGHSAAYADFETASLGAFSGGQLRYPGGNVAPLAQEPGASASLRDAVHFHIPGAGDGTITPITFSIRVSGLLDPVTGLSRANYSGAFSTFFTNSVGVTGHFGSGSFSQQIYVNNNQTAAVQRSTGGAATATGSVSDGHQVFTHSASQQLSASVVGGDAVISDVFSFTFYLRGANPWLNIDLSLGVNGLTNFSDGLSFSLGALPAGVSFSSDSGLFLSAVPEPASYALFGIGLLLIGTRQLGARRRQRQLG